MSKPRVSDAQVVDNVDHVRRFGLTTDECFMLPAGYPADLRDARAEIARLTETYEDRLHDVYQAVSSLISEMGLSDNADCIRIQDVLAYGKTEDGIDLLPWPRDQGALLAERTGVSEALRKHHEWHLEQGDEDFGDGVVINMAKVYLHSALYELTVAALSSPVPAPVDRDAIRAEAFEEAAKIIADIAAREECSSFGESITAAIRSAAKTEASR